MNRFSYDNLIKTGGLKPLDNNCDDLFFCCASYEARSTAVVETLSKSYRCKESIIYVNKEFRPTCETAMGFLSKALRQVSKVRTCEGSWLDQTFQFNALKGAIDAVKSSIENITIDVTTFNREALLVGTLLIRTRWPDARIRIVYSSPQKYADWLSRGYREIRNIIGFTGVHVTKRPTVLVVLCGFEPDRAMLLIEQHEPQLLLLGTGDPPTSNPFLNRNLLEGEKISFSRQEMVKFKFAADSATECFSNLDKAIRKYLKTHNIVVAPMSTKMSTMAVFLLAQKYPQIQITYCVPGEYNTRDYTKGVRNVFVDVL